jgi:hypothetical protein
MRGRSPATHTAEARDMAGDVKREISEERRAHLRAIASKGGRATVARYGKEHMSKLGKKGFRKLCCRFRDNSRKHALAFLNRRGSMAARYAPIYHSAESLARDDAAYTRCMREIDPAF